MESKYLLTLLARKNTDKRLIIRNSLTFIANKYSISELEAISTNRGKKLLVTGWWGWVRHPNYLGFIILHWAWASTAGMSAGFSGNTAISNKKNINFSEFVF